MNKLIITILSIACLFMASCSHDDEPKDKTELITMWVSAETYTKYQWGDDNEKHPIECMQVKCSPDGKWETMIFGTIEGFEYEKGVEYELSVRRTTLFNPPADSSLYTYRLERIISHRIITANTYGLDNCIEIPAEGKVFDIDFTTNAPCKFLNADGSLFGQVELLELYDNGYVYGYSLRLNIPENSGMGRVRCFTLLFNNGDEKKIAIWQMPRQFEASETFVLRGTGSLGYMIGRDQSNFGRIRNIAVVGCMNANDCYFLSKILNSHGYQGYGDKPKYIIDLSWSGFVAGDYSRYFDRDVCNVNKEYLPTVFTNDVPAGVFTSNNYVAQVELPENIESINPSAFSNCIALTKINIPASCIEIGSHAFHSCASLEEVVFPYISEDIDLPHFQKIGQAAFSGIGRLKSFVLPESLKTVETTALSFYVDKLFSLTEEPPVWDVPGNAGYVLGPKPDGCTLYVPYGCSEAYKASEKWGKFKIEEMPEENWWEMIP